MTADLRRLPCRDDRRDGNEAAVARCKLARSQTSPKSTSSVKCPSPGATS
jgi:hypothetical protein